MPRRASDPILTESEDEDDDSLPDLVQPDDPVHVETVEQADKVEQTDSVKQADQVEQTDVVKQADQVEQANKPEEVVEPEAADEVVEPEAADEVVEPKTAEEVDEPDAAEEVGKPEASYGLPLPSISCIFFEAVELWSEVLAAEPQEFTVEWVRSSQLNGRRSQKSSEEAQQDADLSDADFLKSLGLSAPEDSATDEPSDIIRAAWSGMMRDVNNSIRKGTFVVSELPRGEAVQIRIRENARSSGWLEVQLPTPPSDLSPPLPDTKECADFVTSSTEGFPRMRCMRCGLLKAMHYVKTKFSANGASPGQDRKRKEVRSPAIRGQLSKQQESGKDLPEVDGAFGHPAPLAGGLKATRLGDIEFVTNFDGANGYLAVDTDDGPTATKAAHKKLGQWDNLPRYHVVLSPDPEDGTSLTQRKRWFHFGIRAAPGVKPDPPIESKIRIVVNNMSDMTDLFNLDKHRPFWRLVPGLPHWMPVTDLARPVCGYEDGSGRGAGVGRNSKFTVGFDGDEKEQVVVNESLSKDQVLKTLTAFGKQPKQIEGAVERKPGKTCYVAWDFKFPFNIPGTLYFAFAPAYGYSDLQEYLDRLENFFVAGPQPGADLPLYGPGTQMKMEKWQTADVWKVKVGERVSFNRQVMCVTPERRYVNMLTISEASNLSQDVFVELPPLDLRSAVFASGNDMPACDFGPRRPIIFISSRVHPGETPAQFAFFGLLQFILSDDPRARLLRHHFVFKLVPMLNPDGVAHGHTRNNSLGFDLNRCYSNPNPKEHEGVWYLMQWLTHWAQQGRLLFHLDMHAHAHARGCVVYGNALQGAEQVWNVAFAHLCQCNSPHFDQEGCEFPPKSDKEHGHDSTDNSSRSRVAAVCGLYHAYTLECHYSIGRLTRPVQDAPGLENRPLHPGVAAKTFKQVKYDLFVWESIGEAIAVSILDMHGVNPYTRVGTKIHKGLEAVIDTVAAQLKVGSPAAYGGASETRAREDNNSEGVVDARLYRVVFDQVVARDGPAMTRGIVDMYLRGHLVAAEELPDSPWVRVIAPDGEMGGKIGTKVVDSQKKAHMLTDGSQRGLGKLLEPTNMLVRLAEESKPESKEVPRKQVPSRHIVQERHKKSQHLDTVEW